MTFPNAAALAGHNFDDVDGSGYPHHVWMGDVGDALNASFPDFRGSGKPEGVQVANNGQTYLDTDTGLIWQFGGVDGTDTPWTVNALGCVLSPGGASNFVSDYHALYDPSGTGNALYWDNTGGDGAQTFFMQLGSTGQFVTIFKADGTTEFPGPIGANNVTPPAQHAFIDLSGESAEVQELGQLLIDLGFMAAS